MAVLPTHGTVRRTLTARSPLGWGAPASARPAQILRLGGGHQGTPQTTAATRATRSPRRMITRSTSGFARARHRVITRHLPPNRCLGRLGRRWTAVAGPRDLVRVVRVRRGPALRETIVVVSRFPAGQLGR